ncbi:hypothetical protein N8475_07795 [Winogradskyella sp.]|nr:hypothetical protein [Winogradskyella sp.]
MNTITRLVVYSIIALTFAISQAQETKKDSILNDSVLKKAQIDKLEALKENIRAEEREWLKSEIEVINRRLDNDEISAAEAEVLKKKAATKRVANIENRLSIITNKIALIDRNPYKFQNLSETNKMSVSIGSNGFNIDLTDGNDDDDDEYKKPPKYDLRTTNRLVFALGFNNAIGDNQSLDDSPYKLGGSGFVELGWAWQTRLLKDSNFLRLNYGFSFQWNKFDIKNNQYFVQNGDETTLQEFPFDLKKSKFRVTNLVLPLHLEFGPSKKRDYKDRLRYTTDNQFRIGIGGFGGVRLASLQKLIYEDEDGNRVKTKERRNFNASNFVYGLSGYIGLGDLAIYAKYDLSPLFQDQALEQNNISLGLRWDLD